MKQISLNDYHTIFLKFFDDHEQYHFESISEDKKHDTASTNDLNQHT